MNYFGIELVLCDLYLKRFDLTKALLFDPLLITVWNKLCVALFYYTDIGESMYGPGVSSLVSQGSTKPRLKIADAPVVVITQTWS